MHIPAEVAEDMRFIARQYPRFIDWLRAQRESERDALELNGNDVTRGRALALRDILHAFKDAEKFVR